MSRLSLTSIALASICLAPVAAQAAQAPAVMPDGPGKPLVEAVCTTCHNLNMITNSSGYSRAHWQELVGTMADLSGNPKQRDSILDYLATNFPVNNKRPATAVPGDVKISFTAWKVPTLGQRARDPVQTPDGMIWFNGQFGNLIGRIDPKTNEIKEWPLPEGALPHSITPDKDGNIWYTGNHNGTVGKFDVRTGAIKVYPMPDPAAKDPHTAEFDSNGTLWFSLQQSNMLGKLVPATGEIKLVTMPTPRSNPYGVKMDSTGAIWVSCNNSNCLVRMDPKTMAIKEYKLPKPETTVRRLAIASDDTIWYTNSSMGYLGHLDPKTGAIKEYPSPSGRMSHPYGIEIINDVVWYNESGVRPDMLVRFDPKTEKFQSWPIASGNVHAGIVRHMRKTPDGNLLIHQSSTNHIMLVKIGTQVAKR
jgi:virginiamycin B lyase